MIKKVALIGLAALLLAGCNDTLFPAKATEPVAEDPFARPAKIATAEKLAFSAHKSFPGVTKAARNSVLAFRVSGQVEDFPVKSGQELKQGDLIARLDDTPYRNVVAAKQATFDLAKTQLERTKALYEKKHVAKAALDTAESNFSAAEVALKIAKEDVGYTDLVAPYDGVLAKVNVERFQNVSAGQQIVLYQGNKNIDIEFNVPEKIFLIFNPKNMALKPSFDIYFDALPNQIMKAEYKEHDEQPDPVTRSFKVTATMPRPQEFTILPGMSVNVSVDATALLNIKQTVGVVVPLEAVFEEGGKRWVWKVDEQNQARKTEVTVHGIEDEVIRLTDGLAEGDRVIAVGVAHVSEGMKVRAFRKERGL